MELRKLGTSGIKVSPIGLGCMGITHASGTPMEKKDGVEVLRKAYEMGYTFFDTAECYTGIYPSGKIAYNEEVVGEALRPIRNNIVLATKFGVQHGGNHLIMDSRPETIRTSVETLNEICQSVPIPAVAIGGLNDGNMDILKGGKMAGVAVVSAIMKAEDPKAAAARLKEHVGELRG